MEPRRSRAAAAGQGGAAFPAIVTGLSDEASVIEVHAGPGGGPRRARMALATPYRAAEGDRVLVIPGEGSELYVIGVLCSSSAPSIPLPDGGSVTVRGEAAELRDAAGRLIVRYENGAAEIAAPAGDLTLSAPEGRVVVRAGTDVEIDAARDLRQRAGQRFELTATRIVETARDTYREAKELCQARAGRFRALCEDVYAVYSRRTAMASTDDTSIDGKRVLLG